MAVAGIVNTAAAMRRLRFGVIDHNGKGTVYAHALMAAGHIDLVVEAALKDVDICPLIPLIQNAGGVITTWDGGPAEQGGNCVAAATPALHAAAMAVLRG